MRANSLGCISQGDCSHANPAARHAPARPKRSGAARGGAVAPRPTSRCREYTCILFCRRGWECCCCWLCIIGALSALSYLIFHVVVCTLPATTVDYGGYTFHLTSGSSVPNELKRNTDRLNACISKRGQPSIVIHDVAENYYGGNSMCGARIYLDRNTKHETVFIHEYVHYLEDVEHSFGYECAKALFARMQPSNATWGDGHGFPYCYGRPLPNRNEYLAILAEGYCADQCGPSRSYLENTSNAVAVEQRACIYAFLFP